MVLFVKFLVLIFYGLLFIMGDGFFSIIYELVLGLNVVGWRGGVLVRRAGLVFWRGEENFFESMYLKCSAGCLVIGRSESMFIVIRKMGK